MYMYNILLVRENGGIESTIKRRFRMISHLKESSYDDYTILMLQCMRNVDICHIAMYNMHFHWISMDIDMISYNLFFIIYFDSSKCEINMRLLPYTI